MKKALRIIIVFACAVLQTSAQTYVQMMNDPNVNFYDVVREAETYFANRDKGKGSGYTPYLRWKHENESRYYPTGIRNDMSPSFVTDAFSAFSNDKANTSKPNSLQNFTNGWEELGPNTIERITGHYSPGLGRVEDFYINPTDSNRIYLSSRSGGFWRSTDAGKTWKNTTDFLVASGVNTFAVSPTNPNLVTINIRNAANGTSHGLYRSTDGGLTWKQTSFNPTALGKGGLGSNFSVNQISYSPLVDDLLLIAANDGLYRSADNLASWDKITAGGVSEIEFHPTNPSYIYIYDYTGANRNVIFRSNDQGLSFTASNTLTLNNNNSGVRLSVSKNCPNCVFFASSNGVWKSTDYGMNFTFIAKPPTGCDGFAVSDLNAQNMVTGAIDTWVSTDGGANFSQKTWWSLGSTPFDGKSYIHADLRTAKSINGVFYVGTDGYLCKSSDNGTSWVRLNEGTGIREYYSLGTAQSNTYRNYVGSQDNGQSVSTENGWIELYGADGMEGVIHPLNDDWIMGSWQNGGRRRTQDGGTTGTICTPPGQKNATWIAPLFYDPNNPMRVYSVSDSVYRSNDFGTTWTNLGATTIGSATEAAIAENNSNIIYISSGSRLVRSTDGGVSFTPISGLPNYGITDITIHPKNDNTVIVTYNRYQKDSSKVFMTTNGGGTWTNISYNLKDLPVTSVVIDHTPEANIYLGTELGVAYKRMNDTQWQFYNNKLPNVSVLDIKIHYGTNTLRAASWGRGLWEYALAGRTTYPAINKVWITNQPTDNSPKQSQPQYVTAHVTYQKNLSRVYLTWSKTSQSLTNQIEMVKLNDTTYRSVKPLPDGASGSTIFFKVFAVGVGNEISETYKYMYTITPFVYCNAIGADNTTADYINSVAIGDKKYNSDKEKYGNFLDKTFELYTGSTYTLNIGMNYSWDQDTTAAWIDYNHNAEFEPSEMITMSELNATHQSFGTFTVPSSPINDTTRMRVRSQFFNESPNPCGSRTGEVEDYTIVFRRAPKLAFVLSNKEFCDTTTVEFTYSGEPVDSVQWQLTNGTFSYGTSAVTGRVKITKAGSYTVRIVGYKDGKAFTMDSLNAFSYQPLDTTVTQTQNMLQSNAINAQYRWLDCANNFKPIDNATEQTLRIQTSGLYAVEVSSGMCKDTSACIVATFVSVRNDNDQEFSALRCHPNPTTGMFIVESPDLLESSTISVFDLCGRKLQSTNFSNQQRMNIDLSDYASAVYIIEVRSANKRKYFTVTKY